MWIRMNYYGSVSSSYKSGSRSKGKKNYNFNVFQQNSSFKICFQKKVLTYQYAALYDIG